MPLAVLVLIQPNKGKESRAAEVLEWIIGEVKAKEPDVSMYQMSETSDYEKGSVTYWAYFMWVPPLVTICAQSRVDLSTWPLTESRIKDEQTLQQRPNLPHHVELARILKDEALLSDLRYMKLKEFGGFSR